VRKAPCNNNKILSFSLPVEGFNFKKKFINFQKPGLKWCRKKERKGGRKEMPEPRELLDWFYKRICEI